MSLFTNPVDRYFLLQAGRKDISTLEVLSLLDLLNYIASLEMSRGRQPISELVFEQMQAELSILEECLDHTVGLLKRKQTEGGSLNSEQLEKLTLALMAAMSSVGQLEELLEYQRKG